MTTKSLITLCAIALISQTSAIKVAENKRLIPGGWKRDTLIHFDNGHIVNENGGDTMSYYLDYRPWMEPSN